MTDSSASVRLKSLPELGARLPGWVPRAAFGLVALLVCADRFGFGFWFFAGAVLTVVAVALPRFLAAWGLVLLLGASQAFRAPGAWDWHFFALLAALHLLHVIAAQTLVLPVRGWIQLAVFRRPLLRWVLIQLPVQLVALVAFLLLAPDRISALPAIGIAGAAALVVAAALLVVPLLRERARSGYSGSDDRR
jgi:hypothetical protein